MARLPYADLHKASPKVQETISRLEPLNIFRMLAHADSCFRGFIQLGGALLTRSELPAEMRELAVLRVATLCQANYEWTQHVPIARQCGVSQKKIDAIKAGDCGGPIFGELEQNLLQFTDELVARPRVSDSQLSCLRKMLSDRQLVELILTIGYYMMVARLLESTGVDLEAGAGDKSLLA